MAEIIIIPNLGFAERDVRLARWLVAAGASVVRGQTVAVIETLKAAFELEAECDGFLIKQLVSEGARVRIGAPIGVCGAAGETVDEAAFVTILERAPAPRVESGAVEAESAPERPGGVLDPEFYHIIKNEESAFYKLSPRSQIELLREHGAEIGENVQIGEGAVVRAEIMVIGDGARFGAGCRIDCRILRIGAISQFGARTAIRVRKFTCGENAYFAPDVEIGGGGCMDPEAECNIGSHGFVGEHVHINPCRRVSIGDEVVIARGAAIMTHAFAGNILSGYPNRFAGVAIGDGAQIGIHAVVFPGVEVGAGSILLSGSSLVTSAPGGRLFGGVPARDLKAAAVPLSSNEQFEIARGLVLEFGRQLSIRGLNITETQDAGTVDILVERDGARHRLRFARALDSSEGELIAEDVRVGLSAGDHEFNNLAPELCGVDLLQTRVRGPIGPLAAAFREYLRKHGIRLHPRTWTYDGGWL
ncbi:MAG: hypothetical protein HY286_13855 [Planctomycetes bacterium]|nr:hypothetical protein [Planctomycetota bacterium]